MKNLLLYCILIFIIPISACKKGIEQKLSPQFEQNNIKGKAGYFRIGKSTDGSWWFIDPEEKPFFYKGVCAVNRAGTQGGRRAKPGPYASTIDKKYHYQIQSDSFAIKTIDRLKSWGFNALGAWTTEEFFDRDMPYTEILEFFREGPFIELQGSKSIPDVFDSEWRETIDNKARTICSSRQYSKNLVGYFTDNEIGFGNPEDMGLDPGFVAGKVGLTLLREALALDSSKAVYKEAWNFLLNRHAGLPALSNAWNIKINSKEEIKKLNEAKIIIDGDAYKVDARDFSILYAETYFKLAHDAIRRHDPNHLILGCRFGAPPDEYVLEAMKPYVDVISQNNYRPVMYERIDYLYDITGLPVLIGEFSWNTDLFKKVPLMDEKEGISSKERMFSRGETILRRAATHPAMVGYTWYRWVQPKSTDEKFTDGLVDYDDNPDIHHNLLTRINKDLDKIHLDGPLKTTEKQPVSLLLYDFIGNTPFALETELDNGKWQDKANGWRMEGIVSNGTINNETASLQLQIKHHVLDEQNPAIDNDNLTIVLNHYHNKWIGTYKGINKGDSISGKCEAYIF